MDFKAANKFDRGLKASEMPWKAGYIPWKGMSNAFQVSTVLDANP